MTGPRARSLPLARRLPLLVPVGGLAFGPGPVECARVFRGFLVAVAGFLPYVMIALMVMLAAGPREGWERIVDRQRGPGPRSGLPAACPTRLGPVAQVYDPSGAGVTRSTIPANSS